MNPAGGAVPVAQYNVVAVPETPRLIPAIKVDPQTQSVIVLVGVAAKVVLCLVSSRHSQQSHILRTFEKYSRHPASLQGLARVLFQLYRIMRQVWAQA